MGFTEWWERQPRWVKWVVSGLVMFILGVMGSLSPGLLNLLFRILGAQGTAIVITIVVLLAFIVFLSQKYILDTLGRKLDDVVGLLMKMARSLGLRVGEEVRSPGYVYTSCRWLRISREELIDNVRHIYVYCAHPQNPMTGHGCPIDCPYLDTSDKPTGSGAFAGLVLGGLIGLILGGPAGVLIGGLLGAAIGNSLEVIKPVQARISELRARGEPYVLHIDEEKLKR